MQTAAGFMVIFLVACSGSERSEPKGGGGESAGGAGGMVAAAGSTQSGGDAGSPVVPTGDGGQGGDASSGCGLAHREGTYLYSATERANGNCGALPDQVLMIDDALAVPSNCTLDKPDKVSADQCDLTRSFTCALDGGAGSFSAVAFTSETEGGALVAGVLTMRIVDSAGAFVCASSYDVSYERK